jgi:arylsulfate sulfotransferase
MAHSVLKYVNTFSSVKKFLILLGAGILVFISLACAFLFRPAYAPSPIMLAFVKDTVIRQQKIESGIRAYYQARKYTFSAPLVLQDPYQFAPLTALVIFDTPDVSQISIHVPGKTTEASVDFTFPGYQLHHEIPIYGLYAGMLNHVTLRMKTQTGGNAKTEIDLQTEPLPVDMQSFTVDKLNRSQYSPGFNFTSLERKPIFDLNGDVRWYSSQKSFWVFTPLKNGRYVLTYSVGKLISHLMMEQDLLGKIYVIYNISEGIQHDIYELPNGNLLVTSQYNYSNAIEDQIFEIDRSNGHIVRSIDLKDILDPGRPHQVAGLVPNDWLHLNSIVYDPSDHSIIISGKAQSAVVKLSYPSMQIKWILGPHDNWSPKYQPYLLTPIGANFEWPWAQHHATLYAPHVPGSDYTDILLFDNALYRSFTNPNAFPPSQWYSMVVHYRINIASMTVQQVWEYGKQNGPATFSAVRGSAYPLPNGDILGTWGVIYKDDQGNPAVSESKTGTVEAKIIEIVPSNIQGTESGDKVVFECSVPGAEIYRTFRAEFYEGYSEDNAYLSTLLNNTTGNDLVDRSFFAWRDVLRWRKIPLSQWPKKIDHLLLEVIK